MTAPRKVLVLIDALHVGGAERLAVGLATRLPRERYEVTVCTTNRHGVSPLVDELADAGLPLVRLGRAGRFDVLPFRHLLRLLRRERFDVLHSHKHGPNLWGAIFGRLLGRTPVVVAHEHTWSYEGQRLRRFLDGYVIGRLVDRMIAVSTRDQERMTTIEGVPPDKTTYLPNAYMAPPGSDSGGDLRAELGIAPGAPVLGTASVLRAQKAVDVLIDAFAILSKRLPDAQLVIAGYGPMGEEWEQHARDAGVGERVHWLGSRNDVPVVLRGLDVAAMSSDFEGMPMFAFECMAERVPLVATDVGALRDVFDDGVSAMIVPPRDPAAMAAALEGLLLDPERRRAMADAAHARLADFEVERAVERIEALYESLLEERRGRRRRLALSRPAA